MMRTLAEHYSKALVTGASAGLGRAIADMLLGEGIEVWGSARSSERLQPLQAHPRFHGVVMELTDGATTAAAYAAASRAADGFDLVVNNAGYGVFAPFTSEPFETWERQLQAMLVQPMRLAQLALAEFRSRDRGTLVSVSSLAVEFPLPYMSAYNVVKAGLSAFSESLLVETAGTGVSVIDFRPGDYRTDFNRTMSQPSCSVPRAVADAPHLQRIWKTLEANLAAAPSADRAARDLRRALQRGARGTVRSGSFFQARLAPFAMAYLPARLQRAVRWRYFNVR
jgi:short-subunit dehydrogenase